MSACATRGEVAAHRASPLSKRNTNDAHVFACDSCSSNSKIVGVSSTARRKRNQAFSGTWRTVRVGTSLKSTATMPNPPAWISKSIARSA
jgi:hypothetical protein